ncbi:MAG TPA: hypothetical protein VK917_06035 [Ilumatobacter sp.]|nr:hypothetical protein [Ilumatobacter sp.]
MAVGRDAASITSTRRPHIGGSPYSDPDVAIRAAVATAAASARVRTPSLANTRPTWCSTVRGDRYKRAAISGTDERRLGRARHRVQLGARLSGGVDRAERELALDELREQGRAAGHVADELCEGPPQHCAAEGVITTRRVHERQRTAGDDVALVGREQGGRFVDTPLVHPDLRQAGCGVDAMDDADRGVRAERFDDDLFGLGPAAGGEEHTAVGDVAVRPQDLRPATARFEDETMGEPNELCRPRNVTGAVARRQQRAEGGAGDVPIVDLGQGGEGLVEPAEPGPDVTLADERQAAVRERSNLQPGVPVLHGDTTGALGARQQIVDVGTITRDHRELEVSPLDTWPDLLEEPPRPLQPAPSGRRVAEDAPMQLAQSDRNPRRVA